MRYATKAASHLRDAIGKSVVVTLDAPDRDVEAQLDSIGPTGVYVIFKDSGERRRVAAWRVSEKSGYVDMTRVDVGTEQWLRLLELTTAYMTAAEAVIGALQGKLDTKDREQAKRDIARRIKAYSKARRDLILYAREMQAVMTS